METDTDMAVSSFDLAVVGHFSADTIHLPTRKAPLNILGGAATYTSLAAKCLDASVRVISRVGAAFPQAYFWWLQGEGIDLSAVIQHPEEPTTGFELTYSPDFASRTLKLKSKGCPLTLEDLPKDYHAKVVHLGPIANEISYEVAEELKKSADLLSLDPQGLLRSFDEAGNVSDNALVDNHIFSLINIYKSSLLEVFALTGETDLKHAIRAVHDVGVETVIITMGEKGSVLSVEGAQYKIAACPSLVLVDPTGAGDAFIGGFLTEYVRQKETLWCAAVGSASASCVVEAPGSTYFGKKEEIYRRATVLHEKELKQY
ncbi:MAG: carbohydrate kinase family protein [Candidatus Bathyarchaeia archaeon]